MSARWIVEGPRGVFDDVGAATLDVDGGCLVFRDEGGKVVVAYAATSWTSVSEGNQ